MILASGLWGTALPPSMPTVAASLVALVAYAAAVARSDRAVQALRWALLAGWAAHGLALAFDISGLGVAAGTRFGFAPALSMTLWLVLAVYVIESRLVPLPGMRRVLALLGVGAVLLMLLFPGEMRPPNGSALAPLHWVLGIVSYGLFGAAVLHAALLSNADRRMRLRGAATVPTPLGMPLLALEKLTFRFVAGGFVVLSAALLLGWWYASPWRWDHKTVLSVLGWAVFAGLLAGRHAFGWRGRRATRWLYAGAALLLLAYVGSRFVIEVLLPARAAG